MCKKFCVFFTHKCIFSQKYFKKTTLNAVIDIAKSLLLSQRRKCYSRK